MLSKEVLKKAEKVSRHRENLLREYSEYIFLKVLQLFDIPYQTSQLIDRVRIQEGYCLKCDIFFTFGNKYINAEDPKLKPELRKALKEIESCYIPGFIIFKHYISLIKKDLEKQNIYVYFENDSIIITLHESVDSFTKRGN